MGNGLIPTVGRQAFAYWLAHNVTHAAVGSGNWSDPTNPPLETSNETGLVNEIGRVAISAVNFLIADPNGTITYSGDATKYRYATSTEIAAAADNPDGPLAPSADVEVSFEIPANVINGQYICEIGIFLNSTISVSGFATPAQVTNPGIPVYIINIPGDPMYTDKVYDRRVRLDWSN